jgi:DivIVA domain-containing protein
VGQWADGPPGRGWAVTTIGRMAIDPGEVTPEVVAAKVFGFSRRGYSVPEVQSFLRTVAAELRSLSAQCRELERRLAEAESRADRLSGVDDERITEVLGAEATRILDAARDAASGITARATEQSEELLAQARTEAEAMRDEASGLLERRQAEADEVVATQLAESEQALAAARVEADGIVAAGRETGEAAAEEGRQRGRDMVAEAQAVRERMLRDLTRRRRGLRQQIEQLQAGRDRLLEAYDAVRASLDSTTAELNGAPAAAQEAARRVGVAAGPVIDDGTIDDDLLAELADLGVVEQHVGSPASDRDSDGDSDEAPDTGAPERTAVDGGAVADTAAQEEPSTGAVDGGDGGADTPPPALEAVDAPAESAGDGGEESADDESPDALFARLRAEADAETEPEPEPEPGTEAASPGEPEPEPETKAEALPEPEPEPETKAEALPEPEPEPEPELEVQAPPVGDADADAVVVEPSDGADTGAAGDVLLGTGLLARRAAAELEFGPTLSRRLKRTLADEQNTVLDTLRRTKRGVPSLDDLLPPTDEHCQTFADAAVATLAAAADDGVGALGDLAPGVAGPTPTTSVADAARVLAAGIVDALRAAATERLDGGSEDTDELADALRQAYRDVRGVDLDAGAATAVREVWSSAAASAMVSTTLVVWVTDADPVPATCATRLDAEPAPAAEAAGLAPCDPACRCLAVPAD